MSSFKVSAYKMYRSFKQDLEKANGEPEVTTIFLRFLAASNADSAVIVSPPRARDHRPAISSRIGDSTIWSDYLNLCQSNQEPLTRILRLAPHPIALSEIRHRKQLDRRAEPLRELLANHGCNDVLAIPLMDPHPQYSAIVIVGRDLALKSSRRHLLIRSATEVADRILANRHAVSSNEACSKSGLTPRQMEVAPWLVAGKSDWEIGKILSISRKTVNFHVENMKRIYGVKTRLQFVAEFIARDDLKPE